MNKRGYMGDWPVIAIVLLVLAIIIFVASKLGSEVNTGLQDKLDSDQGKQIMSDNTSRFGSVFDWIFISSFVLMVLVVIVTFFMIDTHPALFFVSIIILGMMLIPIGIFSNVFETFSTDTQMSSESAKFPFMDFVISNWGVLLTVAGFIGAIALYAKSKAG